MNIDPNTPQAADSQETEQAAAEQATETETGAAE
jgi:hypothetical protein